MTPCSRGLAALLLSTSIVLPAQETSRAVIKTETRVVLVDAVVTRKGEPVRDLSAKDFKILEDGREQKISSFSFEADPASPIKDQPRYLMFYFDNTTLDLPYQQPIRDAAAQFAAANAGPRRLMSVVEYGPGIQVTQDFTGDGERLKKAISGAKLAHRIEGGFDARETAYALEAMAKRLAKVPGRKALILVSGGMSQLPNDHVALLTDALNKANVAVYPGVDLAGQMASNMAPKANFSSLESLGTNGITGDKQQLLRILMDSTGGSLFYLKDLAGSFERIFKEQDQYYLLGYSPEGAADNRCHHLKVKVLEAGLNVRSRELYCPVKPADLLSGTPV
ncbi:MAG TPA: VWA domain-containing protein, partial [Bryobacteraceae bacterium]